MLSGLELLGGCPVGIRICGWYVHKGAAGFIPARSSILISFKVDTGLRANIPVNLVDQTHLAALLD